MPLRQRAGDPLRIGAADGRLVGALMLAEAARRVGEARSRRERGRLSGRPPGFRGSRGVLGLAFRRFCRGLASGRFCRSPGRFFRGLLRRFVDRRLRFCFDGALFHESARDRRTASFAGSFGLAAIGLSSSGRGSRTAPARRSGRGVRRRTRVILASGADGSISPQAEMSASPARTPTRLFIRLPSLRRRRPTDTRARIRDGTLRSRTAGARVASAPD